MNILTEKRVLASIRLTGNQKKVMTRIVSAATPTLAADAITKGRGLVTARDILIKLGLVEADENTASITANGEEVMRNLNLIDDLGELTDEGEKFAYDEEAPKTESLIKQLNVLAEGKVKELAIDAQELIRDVLDSKLGSDLAAVWDTHPQDVKKVLQKYAEGKNIKPEVIAAAVAYIFRGDIQDYL